MHGLLDYLIFFYCCFFGSLVVLRQNPIESAVSLLFLFVGVAGIYFRINAVYLSGVQIIVYASAIATLFIFVLMLLNLESFKKSLKKSYSTLVGIIIVFIVLGMLVVTFYENSDALMIDLNSDNSFKALFTLLFEKYLIPFELTTVLITGVIFTVITLNKKQFLQDELKK